MIDKHTRIVYFTSLHFPIYVELQLYHILANAINNIIRNLSPFPPYTPRGQTNTWYKKHPVNAKFTGFPLELVVGLEPTTCSLRMSCSTNWAILANINFFISLSDPPPCRFNSNPRPAHYEWAALPNFNRCHLGRNAPNSTTCLPLICAENRPNRLEITELAMLGNDAKSGFFAFY